MQSIIRQVVAKIYGKGRGWVFSKIDFADLGSRSAIDVALYTLEKKGTINRILRGIYCYPEESKLLGEQLPADIPEVARALARKFGWAIEPSGETALNILGISTQVPAKYVYITNGRSRTYRIGNRELRFKKGMLKETGFKHAKSSLLVQAIRALGKDAITDKHISRFRKAIDPDSRIKILRDTKSVSGWIYEAIRKICRDGT